MAAQSSNLEKTINSLLRGIAISTTDVEAIASSIRMFYDDGDNPAQEIKGLEQLRENMRSDAEIFAKYIFQLVQYCINDLKGLITYYSTGMGVDNWCKSLAFVAGDVEKRRIGNSIVMKILQAYIPAIQKKEETANSIIHDVKGFSELDQLLKELSDWQLVFSGDSQIPKFVEKKRSIVYDDIKQSDHMKRTQSKVLTIARIVFPALNELNHSLKSFDEFYDVLGKTLQSIVGENKTDQKTQVAEHLKVMESQAKLIDSACSAFISIVSGSKSSLGAVISGHSLNQAYINGWVQTQTEIIEQCPRAKIKSKLLKEFE